MLWNDPALGGRSAGHLGERDCSVQRRRQKLVEQSPAAALPAPLRERICAAAGPFVRVGTHLHAGMRVSPMYDSVDRLTAAGKV